MTREAILKKYTKESLIDLVLHLEAKLDKESSATDAWFKNAASAGYDLAEANEKLSWAVEALEFYAKQTGCECSPSYVPVRAMEALEKIKAAL